MAYYPNFAPSYPSYYPQQGYQPMTSQQASPTTSGAQTWVGSRQEAQVYPVIPGGGAVLWDSNGPYVYLKQADVTGRPSFSAFKITPADDEPKPEYVTRDELDKLAEKFEKMMKEHERDE